MKRLWYALQAEKRLILIVTALFLVSALMGSVNTEQWRKLFDQLQIFDHFEKMIQGLGANPSWFKVSKEIFINNLTACLMLIGMGALLGIPTISSLMTNGLLLGYINTVSSQETGISGWSLFFTKIVPHGVFELPAIFLAAALGLRIGISVFSSVVSLFKSANRIQSKMAWKEIWQRFPVLLGFIVLLLLVAASIEGLLITSV
ncbi:stage II sporulation protein M [Thermoactinomyces sp. DSM 45892]|uniref:stage II sporulation protein M n=1 Tax=Thermoactinomyces sp. DSM 45892 TaxID=1882753 RepID=UPI000895ECD6|nr:stage II sporulation protein M [Thermoactinomyces sp. DSM 45892]SDY91584.1 stage II sporulation protein M [Thermoactinomyces sp. DSM 45892]